MNGARPQAGAPAASCRRAPGGTGSAYRPFGLGQSRLVVGPTALGALGFALYFLYESRTPARELTWTVARTAGLVADGLPWHPWLGLSTLAFVVVHAAAIVLDPYAGVGLLGALWPGLSKYRTVPVALGTTGLWALALVGLTVRLGQRWLGGVWRSIHKGALIVFILGFFPAVLVGSDTPWLAGWYAVSAGTVWCLALSRYWVAAGPAAGGRPAPSPAGLGSTRVPRQEPAASPGPPGGA